jgi:soluble lytic murein transglycosylase-like protein
MSAPRNILVLGLVAAAALWLLSRTRRGQAGAVDALEFITVTAERIGTAVADALAGLGDWTGRIPEALRGVLASSAAQHGLPPGLLEAVGYRESRYRPEIIDGRVRSSAGAVGVMQIIPRWHPELGEAGALDPQRAIPYAARYLRQLHGQFGSWRLALAAYNWGQGNLQSKDLADGIIGDDWPSETRAYVDEIARNAGLA